MQHYSGFNDTDTDPSLLQVNAVASPPTPTQVKAGQGPLGVAPIAAGSLSQSGSFPWLPNGNITGGVAEPNKLWINVTGLLPATNYTVRPLAWCTFCSVLYNPTLGQEMPLAFLV